MAPTFLFGFSYGIHPDGSPGRINEAIARRLWAFWQDALAPSKPFLVVQWEIYDALTDLGVPLTTITPDMILVAEPSRITADDLGSRGKLLAFLGSPGAPAQRFLGQELQQDPRWAAPNPQKAELAASLDALLDRPTWYRAFQGLLDLPDLHRSNRGLVGLEKRQLPLAGPGGRAALRRYQTIRVNRLIIEEIIPEKLLAVSGSRQWEHHLLKRGAYLNVAGVARNLLGEIKRRGLGNDGRIVVFGHPEHRQWCARETARIASELGLGLHEIMGASDEPWSPDEYWDAASAQVWCRSPENWRYYQTM